MNPIAQDLFGELTELKQLIAYWKLGKSLKYKVINLLWFLTKDVCKSMPANAILLDDASGFCVGKKVIKYGEFNYLIYCVLG